MVPISNGLPDTFKPERLSQNTNESLECGALPGIVPERQLLATSSTCKVSNLASSNGMLPVNTLSFK